MNITNNVFFLLLWLHLHSLFALNKSILSVFKVKTEARATTTWSSPHVMSSQNFAK